MTAPDGMTEERFEQLKAWANLEEPPPLSVEHFSYFAVLREMTDEIERLRNRLKLAQAASRALWKQ